MRAQPVTISDETVDGLFSIGWAGSAVALGNGYALISADRIETGPFGFFDQAKVIGLRNPSDAVVPLTGAAAGDLRWCDEPTNSILARTRLVWSGSTFLMAKECPGTTQLFTISTAGAVTARSSFGGGTDVELASNGAGFLAVFEATNGAGNLDVRARRLSGTGALVGDAITVAGGFGNQFDPAVGASGSTYLVGWTFNGDGTDHSVRTVGAGGALGTSRVLWGDPLDVSDLSIVGGGGGSFFTAWTEAFGNTDVFGLKVAANGTPANANPTDIGVGPADQSDPLLTRGSGATAFVTWFEGPNDSGDIDLTRKLDSDGRSVRRHQPVDPLPVRPELLRRGGGQRAVPRHVAGVADRGQPEPLRAALRPERHAPRGDHHAVHRPRRPVLPDRGVERIEVARRLDRQPLGHQGRVRHVRVRLRRSGIRGGLRHLGPGQPAAVALGGVERHAVRRGLERPPQRQPGHLRRPGQLRRRRARRERHRGRHRGRASSGRRRWPAAAG